jgi:hypothetical protein
MLKISFLSERQDNHHSILVSSLLSKKIQYFLLGNYLALYNCFESESGGNGEDWQDCDCGGSGSLGSVSQVA